MALARHIPPGDTGRMTTRLWRFPFLTATVFVVTGLTNTLQFAVHGTLEHLERTSAGLHGDWWRTVTALFTQDGGVAGTVWNLTLLVMVGAVAEQLVSRPWWLAGYFGAGLAGELAGYAWQPVGAGNSVAICGLAGAIVVTLWFGAGRVTGVAAMVLLLWCGGLVAALWAPLIGAGIVLGAAGRIAGDRGVAVGRPAAVLALASGVALAAHRDIHGAALLAGIVIAALPAVRRRVAVA